MAQYVCSTNSAISRRCIYAALTTDPIALNNSLQILPPPPLEIQHLEMGALAWLSLAFTHTPKLCLQLEK